MALFNIPYGVTYALPFMLCCAHLLLLRSTFHFVLGRRLSCRYLLCSLSINWHPFHSRRPLPSHAQRADLGADLLQSHRVEPFRIRHPILTQQARTANQRSPARICGSWACPLPGRHDLDSIPKLRDKQSLAGWLQVRIFYCHVIDIRRRG
jgi:hypothetical protein